jgi:hypothetical protein
MANEKIAFTRINNDGNGNPRYVCHFLDLNTSEELHPENREWIAVGEKYALALKRANKIGGKKFHNRQYGGGIVFQSYSLKETMNHINDVTKRGFVGYTVD